MCFCISFKYVVRLFEGCVREDCMKYYINTSIYLIILDIVIMVAFLSSSLIVLKVSQAGGRGNEERGDNFHVPSKCYLVPKWE